MNLIVEIVIFIAVLLCLVYTITVALFCIGWMMSVPHYDGPEDDVLVSIIIPARDEKDNLHIVIDDLMAQEYDKTMFEIIVVDDGSSDGTVDMVKKHFDSEKSIQLIANSGSGKKDAITNAMKLAKGELIITVDADGSMDENWLQDIVYFYRETHAKMIVAPVYMDDKRTLFGKMQSLEFMALVASGGGSLYFENAILCNGANLAFTKKVFKEVNGFEGINTIATGDDVLLMYKIQEKFPDRIKFLKSRTALVYIDGKPTLKELINQRKRWASKPFSMLNTETKLISLVVYFFSLFLIVLPLVAFFNPDLVFFEFSLIKIWLLLFSLKCAIDFLLLLLATIFFKEKKLLIYFLPMQFIYLFYVVMVGFLGLSRKYEWKGRTINEKQER